MHHYDDSLDDHLARLRPLPLVSLHCPDCRHTVHGQGEPHARELLAIHQEGTCPGPEGGERPWR